jgi:hypothetical protein
VPSEDRSSQTGGEAHFALAMERRLLRGLRSFLRHRRKGAVRPIEAFMAAIRNGCFTSIREFAQTSQMRKERSFADTLPAGIDENLA